MILSAIIVSTLISLLTHPAIADPSHRPVPQSSSQPLNQRPKLKLKPRLKNDEFLIIKPHSIATLDVSGESNKQMPHPKDPAYFEIVKEKDQLILRFAANDPNLYLSHKDPLVIDLRTDRPFKVEPSLIITKDWPKNADQITLKKTEAKPKTQNRIFGKAAFSYCHRKTQTCTRTLTKLTYFYIP